MESCSFLLSTLSLTILQERSALTLNVRHLFCSRFLGICSFSPNQLQQVTPLTFLCEFSSWKCFSASSALWQSLTPWPEPPDATGFTIIGKRSVLGEMAHVFPGLTSNGETMPSLNLQWLSGFLMPRNKTIPPKILGSSECLTPKRKAVIFFQVFLELSDHKRNEQIASLLPSRHPAGVVCHVDSVHLQYHFHANPETPTRHLPPAKMIGKNREKSESHIFWHVALCVVSWKSHNFDLALTPVSPPQITANGSAFVAWRRASAVKDRLAFSSTFRKAGSIFITPPCTYDSSTKTKLQKPSWWSHVVESY